MKEHMSFKSHQWLEVTFSIKFRSISFKRNLNNYQQCLWMQKIWQTELMKKPWKTQTASHTTIENTKRMNSILFQEVFLKCAHKVELLLVIQLRLISWTKEYLQHLALFSFIAMHFRSFCISHESCRLNWLVQSYTEQYLWSFIHQVLLELYFSIFEKTNKYTTNSMKNIPLYG